VGSLLVIFLIMLVGSKSGFQSAFNQEAHNLFGASGDVYNKTIALAHTNNGGPIVPNLGFSPFFGASLLLVPMLAFWILWPNWGATLYGEVRGASDFRRVRTGMMWGLWVTIAFAVVFVLLVAKTFGWQFFNGANLNYEAVVYQFGKSTIPIFPYAPLLASFYIHNAAIQAIIVLAFGAWFIGWAGTLFLSSTRVVFAAAFDRILPEWAANVSERRHVPFGALALMLIPSIVVSAFYAYTSKFVTYTLDATLVIAVTFFGSAIAATILPWRKPQIYGNSPIARMKIGGVPLITISGAITALFLGWMLFKWFTDDLYGINNKQSLVYMGILYGLAIVVYLISYFVRKSQGINFKAIHSEIPVE